MTSEETLRQKLRKIEALFAGAGSSGEKAAADAAAQRIRTRLREAQSKTEPEDIKVTVPDIWSQKLFIALSRRYGLKPFRYRRMHRQTLIVRAPRPFVEAVLWPEFQQLSSALTAYIAEITDRMIRDEIHGDPTDADELDEPKRIGR